MTRLLALEGVDNFRDFGDYPASVGHVGKGRLYRSAHHRYATDDDLTVMADLGIRTIVDLRRSDERQRDPSRRWSGFDAAVIDNDIGRDENDGWHDFIKSCDLQPATLSNYMADWYRTAALEARHIDLFTRAFGALAAGEGPVLVHCAAGKDRTGILCALVHHVAGVHDDDIVADYLLTNQAVIGSARLARMRAVVEQLNGGKPSDEALRIAMGVEPRFLEIAFDSMRQAHGSIDGYLSKALGIDTATRDRAAAFIHGQG